jgi:hypothetical protein
VSGFVPSAFFPVGAPALSGVTPPAATSEAVAAGGSVTNWTFGAFTDPDGRIVSYSATLVTVTGSGSLSGSGLGPYSITGTSDGDAYTVELDALDGDGGVLATAVHTVAIGVVGGYQTSALIFDGVDAYLEVAPVGSVPAALQFANTDPFTIAVWIRVNNPNDTGQFGSFQGGSAQGYRLGITSGNPYMWVRGGNQTVQATYSYGVANNYAAGRYHLIVGSYDGAGTVRLQIPAIGVDNSSSGTPGTIDYANCATMMGVANTSNPTVGVLDGRVGQVGIWSTDESANVAAIYAGGAIIDWATLTNPPDVLHYKIESTDDPTASGGIADSSGNGLDGTMNNAVAGDLVAVTPGWSA